MNNIQAQILAREEASMAKEVGRLVVRYNSTLDDDDSGKLSLPQNREIGILLALDHNMRATVYWQNTCEYQELWIGNLSFIS